MFTVPLQDQTAGKSHAVRAVYWDCEIVGMEPEAATHPVQSMSRHNLQLPDQIWGTMGGLFVHMLVLGKPGKNVYATFLINLVN